MKRAIPAASVALIFLLAFAATAFAQGAVAPTEDASLLDLLRPVWEAATGHQWWLAGSLALIFAVTAAKRYAPGKAREFLNSDAGGALTVLALSFGGAVATSLATGGNVMSLGLAWGALKVAVGAAGGYALIRKLLVDPLVASAWYKEHAPAWLKSALEFVMWAFLKPSPAIAKAEAAGEAAVAANPPTGADGVAGQPTDL